MEIIEPQTQAQCVRIKAMTIKEFRESYHGVTDKASSLCRSTNYSLIAIVWILCKEDVNNILSYRCALIWLLLSLSLDYFQYFIMALIGAIKYRIEERNVQDKSKLDDAVTEGYPEYTPYISLCCFVLKFFFAIIAVCCLVSQLTKL